MAAIWWWTTKLVKYINNNSNELIKRFLTVFCLICSIGVRFAVMGAKIALVLLLNSFEFSLGSKTTVPLEINKNSVVFSPKGGVYLKVKVFENSQKCRK